MLLNEFLKEHRKVEEQEAAIGQMRATITQLQSIIAQQQKDSEKTASRQQEEIKVLMALVNEQTEQIRKVSAQLEVNRPARQVAVNEEEPSLNARTQ